MTTESNSTPKMGRPSSYDDLSAAKICERLSGGESLRSICADDDMPNRATVMRWLHGSPDFQEQYKLARQLGAEALADEVVALAMEATPGNANVVRAKIDAVKWAAAHFAPRRWGDRVVQEHVGPDGAPLQLQPVAARMVPEEVGAAVRKLISKAEQSAGLPSNESADDTSRLKAIMNSGQPLDPDLYEAIYAGGDKG
jgi:hypothetical protein